MQSQRAPSPETSFLSGAWQRLADGSAAPAETPGQAGLHPFSNIPILPPSGAPASPRAGSEVLNRGMQGSGAPLSHLQRIQQSFGPFDLSSLRVHSGAAAKSAAESISAQAFTHGEHIVSPEPMDLRVEAHEAAHAIQQRQPGLVPAGISSPADAGERHADAVAERVMHGRSAVDLLTQVAPLGTHASTGAPGPSVQCRRPPKTSAGRLSDTLSFIEKYVQDSKDQQLKTNWQQVKQRLQTWQEDDNKQHERQRIGTHMHVGSGGTEQQRAIRRTLILLRSAILRNESDKAQTDVGRIGADQLGTELASTIQASANYAPLVTKRYEEEKLFNPWAAADRERTDAESASNRKWAALRGIYQQEHGYIGTKEKEEAFQLYARDAASEEKEKLRQTKARANELAAPLNAYREERKQRAQLIYQPSREADGPMKGNIEYLNYKLITVGGSGLAALQPGGELYVVSHGNFGVGVGTHTDHKDAPRLLSDMERAGLPRSPDTPVELYIWACWGAVNTETRSFGRTSNRKPFAQRLASAMAGRNYNNYNIIGFAGSVSKSQVHQTVTVQNGHETESDEVTPSQFHSIYSVRNRDYHRTQGEDWVANVSNTDTSEIYKVKRTPAT